MRDAKDQKAAIAASVVKHTPGPWVVTKPTSNNYRYEVHGEQGPRGAVRVVARVPAPNGRATDAEYNAQLIAAAPALADALEALYRHHEGSHAADEYCEDWCGLFRGIAGPALRAAGRITTDAAEPPIEEDP